MEQTLKIGIPDGSLIDPERGGLKGLLDKARIYTKNLGTNKAVEITNIPWLGAIAQRPQEMPYLAAQGYCDVFFCGDDWAKEWELRGYPSKKLARLNIGKVKIVAAAKPGNECCRIAASEYPFIAKKYLEQEFAATDVKIVRYGEQIGSRFAVIDSFGKTELKVIYGMADMVIENTQSGDTLKNLDLAVTDNLFCSECSLYASYKMDDEWKIEKANRIKMMLEGAVNAKDRDLVIFNAKNENLDAVLSYIRQNKLFANEETLVKGENFSEITLELSATDRQKPLIDILGDLKDLGASSIEGIPLSYSIR